MCGGMRHGSHHLYDDVDDNNSKKPEVMASMSMHKTSHLRIKDEMTMSRIGGTLNAMTGKSAGHASNSIVDEFIDDVDDIRDEDFDDE